MYGDIDFDIEKVETIIYSPEYIPDVEDFDINDYNSEEEMKEDMLHSYTFYIENFNDPFGERLNDRGVEMGYDDVVEYFGEEIANSMLKNEGIPRGGRSKELTIGVDTTPKSMSLQDVGDVAKKVLPTTSYFRGCRGFILYDGTIVATEAEHNMCSVIEGINGTFQFIELGNIRILNQSVDLAKEPTQQQRRVLAQVINSYSDGDFYLDIMTGDNIGVHYYQADYRKVLSDIDRYFTNGIKPTGNQLYEGMVNEKKEETTFYRFYSEIRAFLSKLLKTPIKAEPNKYLTDREFTKTRLIKLLRDNDIIKRDEKILVPGTNDVKHVTYSVKYTLKSDKFEDKIEQIYKKYFPDEEEIKEGVIKRHVISSILNEEMNMYSCANIIGVVSGKGKGVGSEMCDRWAKYVNDNKNKKRTVFKDESDEELEKKK